ncbi:MAG: tetratricopeptide repeat protein [Candidatus Hydrogenedentes bacterium]|nr:tetratricopeptide repeat protein [Candidatus Hydrogenedentota bacterium]
MNKDKLKYLNTILFHAIVFSFTVACFAQQNSSTQEEKTLLDFANGLYSRQFFKEALDEYKNFIAKYPNSPNVGEALLRLGKCALLEKQYELAINSFDQALSKLTDSSKKLEATISKAECLYYLKRWAECTELLKNVLDSGTDSSLLPRAMYFYARTLDQTQNYQLAISILNEMISKYPDHQLTPFGKFLLGNLYAKTGELENSSAILTELANDSRVSKEIRVESVFRVAELSTQLGWFESAVKTYETLRNQFKGSKYQEKADFGYIHALYQSGKFDSVIEECKSYVQAYPSSDKVPFVTYILANSLLEQNRHDEALSYYELLRTKYPDSSYAVDSIYKTAWIKFIKKDYESAKKEVLTFLERGESSSLKPEGEFLIGCIYVIEGNFEDAMEEFQVVFEKYPTNRFAGEALYKYAECAEHLGVYQIALKSYEKFIQNYPAHSLLLNAYLRMADLLAKQNDWRKALESLLKSKELSAGKEMEEAVLLRVAVCYEKLGETDSALNTYEELIKKFPSSPQVYDAKIRIASYYIKDKKDPLKALEVAESLLAQNPPSEIAGKVWHIISIASYEMNNYERSAEALMNVVTKYPMTVIDSEQFAWLAQYYLDSQKCEQAIVVLRKMIETLKDYPAPHKLQFKLAECLQNLGKSEEAILEYTKVVEIAPTSTYASESLYKIAQLYEGMGKVEQALEYYERCANSGSSETSARAQFHLAEMFEAKGEFEKAGRNYLKVAILFLHPDLSPESLWRASNCYLKINENKKAETALRELINDFPSHPLAEQAKNLINQVTENTGTLPSAQVSQ